MNILFHSKDRATYFVKHFKEFCTWLMDSAYHSPTTVSKCSHKADALISWWTIQATDEK